VEVWVKSWAEVLTGCKSRLQFVQDHLQATVDQESALQYLKKTYDKYLVGVLSDSDPSEANTAEEATPAK